jgi:protein-S-isoprenylcysteine O-methyltransferase Ste14
MPVPENDHPGVIAHPPFIFLGGILIGAGFQRLWPWTIFSTTGIGLRTIGILCLLGAAFVVASGAVLMKSAGTNVRPDRPTTAIIQRGPYRVSRNPLYMALTLAYLGLTIPINTWWCVLFLPPILLAMHFGVVLREEHYLERKFGDAYHNYCRRVRRYL